MSHIKHYVLVNREVVEAADWMDWARFFQNMDNRRVALTTLPDRTEVSTVFIGMDHNWSDEGPPLLFESAVNRHDGEGYDIVTRYSTWAEAEAGHAQIVAALLAKLREANE